MSSAARSIMSAGLQPIRNNKRAEENLRSFVIIMILSTYMKSPFLCAEIVKYKELNEIKISKKFRKHINQLTKNSEGV